MLRKKSKTEADNVTLAGVKKEMAKPRMARSTRVADLKFDTSRIVEYPRTIVPGTVEKVVPSPRPSQPEKVQIVVEENSPGYRRLRIENRLPDEYGADVKLKKGAHVEVTVKANDEHRR